MNLLQGPHWPSLGAILIGVVVLIVVYHLMFHMGRKR